jgi:hypothetical protein
VGRGSHNKKYNTHTEHGEIEIAAATAAAATEERKTSSQEIERKRKESIFGAALFFTVFSRLSNVCDEALMTLTIAFDCAHFRPLSRALDFITREPWLDLFSAR